MSDDDVWSATRPPTTPPPWQPPGGPRRPVGLRRQARLLRQHLGQVSLPLLEAKVAASMPVEDAEQVIAEHGLAR